jgi:hypothetical protein
MRLLKAMFCAAALAVCIAPGARADQINKQTFLTFSGPVQLPGVTLPAGTYQFKLADVQGNRHIVQVFDKDGTKLFGTMMTVAAQRTEPSGDPVILFAERPSGMPQAVKIWYYPGDLIGDEFIYPKSQAMKIAKATHQPVLAQTEETPANSNSSNATYQGQIARIDENGNAGSAEQAPMSSAQPAANASSQAAGTTGTTANAASGSTRRSRLPQTASSLPVLELLTTLVLAAGFATRELRTRWVEAR